MACYIKAKHQLDRLRISLAAPPPYAESLTEECSRLFFQRLRTLIASVLDKVQQECGDLLLTEPLSLNLGELPLIGFDNHFCRCLEEQLLHTLLGYCRHAALSSSHAGRNRLGDSRAARRGEGGQRDQAISSAQSSLQSNSLTLFSHYLDNGFWPTIEYWSGPGTLDEWLLRHLAEPRQNWLPRLAVHCLTQAALRRLCQALQPATLARLCQYLAPSQTLAEPVTQGTLMLCALCHFQQYPQKDIPDAWPLVASAFVPLGYEPLLATLFHDYTTTVPVFATWLRTLWGQPTVRRMLQRQLTSGAYHQLRRWSEDVPAVQPRVLDRAEGVPAVQPRVLDRAEDVPAVQPRVLDSAKTFDVVSQPVNVGNGGITLLWPLLPGLFEQLGLWQEGRFLHIQAQHNAVGWLDELIWADQQYAEWRMPLNKLLCGLPLELSPEWVLPTTREIEVMQQWMLQLPKRLPGWCRLSVMDIRQLFLQRPAWLIPDQEDLVLYIQPEMYDVLLNDWPWPIEIVKLPWMKQLLNVRWDKPPVR